MGGFITFEGIEGCGKSTQMGLLKAHLLKKGLDVITVREPGGTGLGERIRSILTSTGAGISPWAELFLFEACRAELVKETIRPALDNGVTVICDRFTDSTLAYQGFGRGLAKEAISAVNALATGGLKPGITFLIDCPPEVGLERAWSRIRGKEGAREDRFEKEDISFHKKVREGYLRIAAGEPGRVRVIDGSRDIHSIHKEICDIIG